MLMFPLQFSRQFPGGTILPVKENFVVSSTA